jgi:phosphoenolpyruvate-protein phosphotransferase/dihydroxyacetone kinase phosphotransfer subunit
VAQVGLVVVSHSRALAEAAVALAREMAGPEVPIEVAAGLDDGALGTDAVAISAAVTAADGAADGGAGVVVLMDLGSAVLSAETALELLDDEVRERVLLCPAALVEGLVGAAVTAAGGATREQVAAEALAGLAAKQAHLSGPDPVTAPAPAGGGQVTGSFTVGEPHGLHARPAARLVQLAGSLGASLELRNATTGTDWAPATSLSRVATLGAEHGHEVQVRASGPGAAEALRALLTAAGRGWGVETGDAPPQAARPLSQPPVAAGRPVPASPGIGVGPAWSLRPSVLRLPTTPSGDARSEQARLDEAREVCRAEIGRTRSATAAAIGTGEAAVFDAHLLLLDDDDLLTDAAARIQDGAPAAAAWAAAVDRVQAALAALPDPYLKERAADVRAVGDQVLARLLGRDGPTPDLAAASGVVLAPDLTPAQAASMDPDRIVGVVLAGGSPTAHSAILARTRGIPAVVGAGPAVLTVDDGTVVALDGETGELVLDPGPDVLARFRARAVELAAAGRRAQERAGSPARTRDGVAVLVGANIGSVADARLAAECGADLAGLVRTEFLFLGRDAAPDVEEQETVYRELAHALGGRRLTLRTLDVGGDKPLPYLPVPGEANPFLGLRGLRLSLAHPGLLADQLLAIVRVAAETPVSLMFPMVSTVAELVQARALLDGAVTRAGRGRPAGLQLGIMVEVPAAALKTAAFAPLVDFLSIGTNDLTQYALAADRGNGSLGGLGDPYDPGVLRLVAAVCAGAGRALVAVCGELAADERAAVLLVGLGVRELSVTPRAVPGVKQAVRGLDLGRSAVTAGRALDEDGPDEVRRLLDDRV